MRTIERGMVATGVVAFCLILLSGVSGRAQTVEFTFVGQGFG